jgi:hypothetical protein
VARGLGWGRRAAQLFGRVDVDVAAVLWMRACAVLFFSSQKNQTRGESGDRNIDPGYHHQHSPTSGNFLEKRIY